MTKKLTLEYIGLVLADAATRRWFGLYDYSSYKGALPPHVVRNEMSGMEVFRSDDREAALLEFQRLTRIRIAEVVLVAMRDPTEAMCQAAALYYHDNYRKGHAKEDTNAAIIWAAMIDELLGAKDGRSARDGRHTLADISDNDLQQP